MKTMRIPGPDALSMKAIVGSTIFYRATSSKTSSLQWRTSGPGHDTNKAAVDNSKYVYGFGAEAVAPVERFLVAGAFVRTEPHLFDLAH